MTKHCDTIVAGHSRTSRGEVHFCSYDPTNFHKTNHHVTNVVCPGAEAIQHVFGQHWASEHEHDVVDNIDYDVRLAVVNVTNVGQRVLS